MTFETIAIGVVLAYLLGSLPSSVWVGQAYHGIDIRDYGSGNAGATNTFRVLGRKAGVLVMAMDVFKGLTAVTLATVWMQLGFVPETQIILVKLIFGISAVLGHIFPIYIGFRGGKGVATLLGMVLGINPLAAAICVAVFMIVLLLTRYVSISSIMGTLSFPLTLLLTDIQPNDQILVVFGFIFSIAVIFTHKKNILRILNGTENKANFRTKKNR
ncbi:MAG: glycerol-3-phosphate 1-O-acyltransferase PlsY [Cyclobacteriaceae bacterium]|nr:glycerol-3-phosphate 1-O-acyltransferase PlsY [Cyclobacteriaceae bacterium]